MSRRVLITGARAPSALDLARAFAAAGHRVWMADCRTVWSARLSRTASGTLAYASPVHNFDRFAEDIARLIDDLEIDLIVPVCEEVFHLARLARTQTRLDDILAAPPLETLARLHSKYDFIAMCAAKGIDAPQTWRLDGRDALTALPDPTTLVFKPEFSRFGVEAVIRPNHDAAARIAPTPERPWVAQTYIEGAEACFYAVAREGRLKAFSSYRSTWRTHGGAGYAFAPVSRETHAALRYIAERLAPCVGEGQFACDAIINAEGRPWLIECNPRATSGVHLFDRDPGLAGVFTGDGGADVQDFQPRHLAPALWLIGLPLALGGGRTDAWRRTRAVSQDVISAPGDRGPLAGALIDGAVFALEALTSGRRLSATMTADIEWNGA